MKDNQSIHITIKQPPNPEPVRSLGIFEDPDNPAIPQLIQSLISGIKFEPKSSEFDINVKDEAYKLLGHAKPIGMIRQGKLVAIYLQE